MDSLGRLGDMLEPNSAGVDTEKLSTEFKAAARHLTSLFRSAQGTATTAHRAGYLAALADIKAGLAARAKSSPNDSPSETIDWLHHHLSARTDALTAPEDPDDDPAPRPPRPLSATGSPPPQHVLPAASAPAPAPAAHTLAASSTNNISSEAQRVQAILSRPAWTRASAAPAQAPSNSLQATVAPVPLNEQPNSPSAIQEESAGLKNSLDSTHSTTTPVFAASNASTTPVAQSTSTPVFGFSLPPGAPRLPTGLGFAAYAAHPSTSLRRRQDRSASPSNDDESEVDESYDDPSPVPVNSSAPVVHARPPVSWPERKRPRKPETPKSKRAAARRATQSPHGGRRRRRDDRRPLD